LKIRTNLRTVWQQGGVLGNKKQMPHDDGRCSTYLLFNPTTAIGAADVIQIDTNLQSLIQDFREIRHKMGGSIPCFVNISARSYREMI
jgi:hypothetical protein